MRMRAVPRRMHAGLDWPGTCNGHPKGRGLLAPRRPSRRVQGGGGKSVSGAPRRAAEQRGGHLGKRGGRGTCPLHRAQGRRARPGAQSVSRSAVRAQERSACASKPPSGGFRIRLKLKGPAGRRPCRPPAAAAALEAARKQGRRTRGAHKARCGRRPRRAPEGRGASRRAGAPPRARGARHRQTGAGSAVAGGARPGAGTQVLPRNPRWVRNVGHRVIYCGKRRAGSKP
jgi:hypothetical protein